MQITNILFSLLVATSVAAKGNKTSKAVTDKSLCKEMGSLEKTVKLASNTTKLEAKLKNNATKIAAFQTKAAAAAVSLADMQANTTLVETCAVISAAEDTKDACEDMADFQKLISLAANTTALDAKTKGNTTKADAIKAKAEKAQTKLTEMSANTTLTDACSTISAAKAEKKAAKASDAQQAKAAAATSSSATAKATSAADMISARVCLVGTVLMIAAGMVML